jgi:Fuc2NAc and GlcNAc transferase
MDGLIVAIAAATFVVSLALTRLVRGLALRGSLLDRPNERSAHVRPTPRLGGIGIMSAFLPAAVVLTLLYGGGAKVLLTLLATAVIALVGFVDDLRPLRARWRFGAQLLAAAAVVVINASNLTAAWTLLPAPVWLLAPLSVLWIVWLTNLYNFMDGIDGLASGQAVIGGAAIAVAAYAGSTLQGALAVVLVVAALGFLLFNFPPASIFMGDVGSTAIGFFFAVIPFLPGSTISVEVVALSLVLFVLDATATLVRRLISGQRVYEAHRSHWYQRPLACGVLHQTITLSAYAGMVLAGALAVRYPAAALLRDRIGLLGMAAALFAAYAGVVLAVERRHRALAQVRADS